MLFKYRFLPIFALFVLVFTVVQCNKDFIVVGNEVLGVSAIKTNQELIPVFTFQEHLEKVQTNGLSLVQLGVINHPVFGHSEAYFTTQLSISDSPIFGVYSQSLEEDEDNDNILIIPENEKVQEVYLEIPFFNNTNDRDADGVIDILDSDPDDPQSNSDGDELTDLVETNAGLNPLSSDSDNDGILDHDDDDNATYDNENKVYEIDSIYGNREATFNLKVQELNYYLNSLDPSMNFETAQAYYSNQDFLAEGFGGETLFDGNVSLSFDELRFNYAQDDPETADVDETTQVETRLTPRLRIPLNSTFFQERVIDMEGAPELANLGNFQAYLKGIIVHADGFSDDLYMLLDIGNAAIKINYIYDKYNKQGTEDDITDDTIDQIPTTFSIGMNGIRVNHLKNEAFDTSILERIASSKLGEPSDKVFVKSGQFHGKVRLFTPEANSNDNTLLNNLRNQSWLINEANLVFYLDQNSLTSDDALVAPRLYLYKYNSGNPVIDYNNDLTTPVASGSTQAKRIFSGILERDENNRPYRYKFRITNHISQILRKDSLNVDLGVVVTGNIGDATLKKGFIDDANVIDYPAAAVLNPLGTVLIGSNPGVENEDKKVKLELLYTAF